MGGDQRLKQAPIGPTSGPGREDRDPAKRPLPG